MIRIAIDGPGGAGKSSIAKIVAERMNIEYIDTGAMYRAVGWKLLHDQINAEDVTAVRNMMEHTVMDFDRNRIILDGQDITGEIRTPEVSRMASLGSKLSCVREKLVAIQRQIAEGKSVIMDGRDIGTNVLKDAEVKIYLDADPTVRAERRVKQLAESGVKADFDDILRDIRSRDEQDMNRELNPLRRAEDAVYLDTSHLTMEESIQAVIDIIEEHHEQ